MISFKNSLSFNSEATLIFLTSDDLKSKKFIFKNSDLAALINSLQKSGAFQAEAGEIFPLVYRNKLILLAGLGKKADVTGTSIRIQTRRAIISGLLKKLKNIEILPADSSEASLKAVVEGILIGGYSWNKYKAPSLNTVSVSDKKYSVIGKVTKTLENTIEICEGVTLTRNLINDNADTVTSKYIEQTIRGIIKGKSGIKLEVLSEKEMKAKGLNLHLAVNKGSRNEPKLIIVKYSGGSARDPFTAFVGKGITFDTGGLNLKPTGSIETMRTDMSGAAGVIGTLRNILALKVKKNIIFAVAVAENTIGSGAFKPGDVYRSYSGKTVEIANTDAEGRLVLADAIGYIVKNYKPGTIIDMATLTGACVVALGHDYAGLVTNNDNLSRELIHASNETDDRVWRLPIYPEIKDAIKSQMADIRNLGFPKGAAGACTAAEFLRQFIGDAKWAHLDIAGTAYVDGAGRMYYGFGATGFGVRLLTHYFLYH